MAWWQIWKRRTSTEDPRLAAWRSDWQVAAAAPSREQAAILRSRLGGLALPDEEVEIELEMLEGLEQLADLVGRSGSGLPAVETGHRIVGTDVCHFSAPASMPDEPGQPSGRLILTSTRAIFLGGPQGTTVRWHTVGATRQTDRDLLLVRADRESLHRFRCNSFGEAMAAAFIARTLAAAASRRRV